MNRLHNQIRFRLVRVGCLVLAPYWYLRIWLTSEKMRPRDYFLRELANTDSRVMQPMLLVAVLSIAARSFDAVLAVRAIQAISSPYPLWALSIRDIRLLLEAPLWLGDDRQFAIVSNGLLQSAEVNARTSELVAAYQSLIQKGTSEAITNAGQLTLPAIHWERLGVKLDAEGHVQESIDALYQALRFVPDTDPRRSELVARYLRLGAMLRATNEDH